jgi:hypothetical protein
MSKQYLRCFMCNSHGIELVIVGITNRKVTAKPCIYCNYPTYIYNMPHKYQKCVPSPSPSPSPEPDEEDET